MHIPLPFQGNITFFYHGPSSQENLDFSDRENLSRNFDTIAGSINLTNCRATGNVATISGQVNLERGTLRGSVSTTSGAVSVNGCAVSGQVSSTSGSVKLSNGASVKTGDRSGQAIETVSGSIEATDSEVQGRIKTVAGGITLRNTTVQGDVAAGNGAITIGGHTTVNGTITAAGDSLSIGDSSHIEKLVLKAPASAAQGGTVRQSLRGGGTRTFINSGTVTINGRLVQPRGTNPNRARPHTQTIFIGSNSKVGEIDFEASTCRVVLDEGAEYLGPRRQGMTIEEPRSSRSTRHELNSRINVQAPPRGQPPVQSSSAAVAPASIPSVLRGGGPARPTAPARDERHSIQSLLNDSPASSSRHRSSNARSSPNVSSRVPPNLASTDPARGDSTQTAPASGSAAPTIVTGSSTADDGIDGIALEQAFVPTSLRRNDWAEQVAQRRLKIAELGASYIDGLRGERSDRVQSNIESMNNETKAKAITAIIYGTMLEVDLDKGSEICARLEALCKNARGVANEIATYIDADDFDVRLAAAGSFAVLNGRNRDRLPYAGQMMLDTLGIQSRQ